jgi:hypothetical protein
VFTIEILFNFLFPPQIYLPITKENRYGLNSFFKTKTIVFVRFCQEGCDISRNKCDICNLHTRGVFKKTDVTHFNYVEDHFLAGTIGGKKF